MPIITKKDEKVAEVIESLSVRYTPEEFVAKFQKMYPKDWAKIEKSYKNHVRKTEPGKKIPMPKPEQYLKNALNVCKKRTNRT